MFKSVRLNHPLFLTCWKFWKSVNIAEVMGN